MQIERELQKFLGGIRGADYGADEKMKVCTGKWGCGAFGGNTYLKFIIQWIACSMANKDMIFTCQEE
jgi:poly(ADP-ribose) glycohydrolase